MEIFQIYGQQKTLTQWDVGRRVAIGEKCDCIHFANAAMTEAIPAAAVQTGEVWVAPIPDEVLQVAGVLRVYAFVADGTEQYTKRTQNLFIRAKPKPSNYIYTPTHGVSWEEMTARVEALENAQETDPTVPAWAKQAQKPAYSAPEVGAAPAGFGLGTYGSQAYTEANQMLYDGWYRCDNVANTPYSLGWMHVSAREANWLHQTFYVAAPYDFSYSPVLTRSRKNSEWTEWEWVNPPMIPGVEYRTTEKWNGKPVYTQFFDLGLYASGGVVTRNLGYSVAVIQSYGVAQSGSSQCMTFPNRDPDMPSVNVVTQDNHDIQFNMASAKYGIGYNTYVRIKYIRY